MASILRSWRFGPLTVGATCCAASFAYAGTTGGNAPGSPSDAPKKDSPSVAADSGSAEMALKGVGVLLLLGGAASTAVMMYLQPFPVIKVVQTAGTAKVTGNTFYNKIAFKEISGKQIDAAMYAKNKTSVPPVTVFYPLANESSAGRSNWLPQQDVRFVQALTNMRPIPQFVLNDFRYNCYIDAVETTASNASGPISTAAPFTGEGNESLNVMVFSHGLYGFPREYSSLLMNFASRGCVVVAPHHCDGSASVVLDPADGHKTVLAAFNDKLEWTPKDREPQEEVRTAEMLTTIAHLRPILEKVYKEDKPKKIKLTLCGHSFGGSSALCAALELNNKQRGILSDANIELTSVVCFDPWIVPLQRKLFYGQLAPAAPKKKKKVDGEEPTEEDKRKEEEEKKAYEAAAATFVPKQYDTPTLLFQSLEWTKFKQSFQFFDQVVATLKQNYTKKNQGKELYAVNQSSKGTGHATVMDGSILSPYYFQNKFMKGNSSETKIAEWCDEATAFINGNNNKK